MASTVTAGFIGSRKTSLGVNQTIGDAAPALVICTFVKTASCTTAPNSAAIPESRSSNTHSPTLSENISQKRRARHIAPLAAFRKYLLLITGEIHRKVSRNRSELPWYSRRQMTIEH